MAGPDGGGLCFAGRWTLDPETVEFNAIHLQVKFSFLRWLRATDAQAVFWQLALGKAAESPFRFEHMRAERDLMRS